MKIIEHSERFWTHLCEITVKALKSTLPFVLTLLILLCSVQPFSLKLLRDISPLLVLLPLYFWFLHVPKAMPLGLVFLLGLVMDILYTYPLGLQGLLFFLLYGGVRLYRDKMLEKREKENSWLLEVLFFGLLVLLYQLLLTGFLMLDRGITLEITSFIFRVLVMVLLYVTILPIFCLCRRFCK